MLKKDLSKQSSNSERDCVESVTELFDDIQKKQEAIRLKREKIKEEFQDGARLSRHRFTL